MMKKIEDGKDRIILDAGDFSGQKSYRQLKVSNLIFQIFSKMNYTAILPGEQELYLGIQELNKMSKENKVPIVCTNLVDNNSGKKVFNEYIIKSTKSKGLFGKKIKIGITGVIDDLFYNVLPELKEKNLSIIPPEKALEQIIPVLKNKEKVDLIILLSHTTFQKTIKIKEKFPGLNVIITAHEGNVQKNKEYKQNETILLKEAAKGTSLSWLQIYFDKKGKITNALGNDVELKLDLPEDPETLKLVDKLEKQVIAPARKLESIQTYVTSQKCASCHQKEFSHWVKTPHARAFDTLISKGKENERECLKCHVTGAGTHMGFGDLKSTPEFINVQCESCHGPGYNHAEKPDKNYGKINPISCLICHDKKNDPTFKFEEKYKKVLHNQ